MINLKNERMNMRKTLCVAITFLALLVNERELFAGPGDEDHEQWSFSAFVRKYLCCCGKQPDDDKQKSKRRRQNEGTSSSYGRLPTYTQEKLREGFHR